MRLHRRPTARHQRRTAMPAALFLVLLAMVIVTGCGRLVTMPERSSNDARGTSTMTSLPAANCPPAPTASGKPQLYWAPSTPHAQGPYARPQALCGVGFQSGEQVALSVETGSGEPSGVSSMTVTANSSGAFAADYVPVVRCGSVAQQLVVHAQGNKGSTTSVSMPSPLPIACQPA